MTWPLKCDDIDDDQEIVACINSPLAVYISCVLISIIPGLTIFLFPLAKKPAYLSVTNVLLAFGMSLSTGSLFYLLFPSCLEDKKKFENEHTLLRHVGSILCSCVWFFFIFDRLTKLFFAERMLEQERKAKSDSFKFEEIPYQRKRETMMKIPQNTFGDRKTAIYETSGGRITIAGDAMSTHGSMHRSTRAFKSSRTTRMTFIQAASSTTDSIYSMSHIGSMSRAEIANAIAGVGKAGLVNLQSDVRFNKVRLPKKSDFTLKGLDKVKRYAWLVLLQNGFATFCAGMVIAASFYISLAEGIIIAFSFIWQETLHRCGDYITLIKNGVNPLQSMFFIFLSSIMVIPGAILGMYISHDHQEQWIFALGCGYFMYNSFGIVLPELDEAEARSVWLEAKPMKPFILQNSGLAAGFIICAVFAYVEFEIDWKW